MGVDPSPATRLVRCASRSRSTQPPSPLLSPRLWRCRWCPLVRPCLRPAPYYDDKFTPTKHLTPPPHHSSNGRRKIQGGHICKSAWFSDIAMQAFRSAPRLSGGLVGALRHSSTGAAGRGLTAASPSYGIAIARRGVWAPGRPLAATAVDVAAVTRRWCSTSPAEQLPPKIKDLVDQIASLTLLEAAQLTDALKVRLLTLIHQEAARRPRGVCAVRHRRAPASSQRPSRRGARAPLSSRPVDPSSHVAPHRSVWALATR